MRCCLFSLVFIFFNSALLYASEVLGTKERRGDYEIRYFDKQLPPQHILDKQEELHIVDDKAQYQGDHDRRWYRQNRSRDNKYISFEINYNLADDADVISNRVYYPALDQDYQGSLNYSGDMDMKGALGLAFAFGYNKFEVLGFELEANYTRLNINNFISNFGVISLDSGNYLETGPEVVADSTEVLNIIAGTANLVLNFENKSKFTPYLGAGYGYSFIGVTSEYDAYPVYLYKAGVNYRLNDKMRLYLAGKMMFYDEVKYPYTITEANATNTNYDKRTYILKHELDVMSASIGYRFSF